MMGKFWLVCTRCLQRMPFDLKGKCSCGGTLLVEYDLDSVSGTLNKNVLRERSATMWRYYELLPIHNLESIVSLGEGMTPLLRLHALEKKLAIRKLYVKHEEQNPTGSFKARGFSCSVSILNERGIRKVTVPSNGNAASALAAYAGRAGMDAFVFVPKDCPKMIVEECIQYGAATFLVDGLIHDAGKIIEDGKKEQGWFNVGTLKEPGRVEGKKTMGLELAEQLQWKMPDVIVYPTGGGSGIVGLWKAFHELKALGFIEGELPRLVSVQEEGCQPIVNLIHNGPSSPNGSVCVQSNPTGLRVPNPPDADLIVSIIRQTNGTAITVTKDEIQLAQKLFGCHGVSSSPEGAATLAGLMRLCDDGWVGAHDCIVLFNTSHAMKYLPWDGGSLVPVIRDYSDYKKCL